MFQNVGFPKSPLSKKCMQLCGASKSQNRHILFSSFFIFFLGVLAHVMLAAVQQQHTWYAHNSGAQIKSYLFEKSSNRRWRAAKAPVNNRSLQHALQKLNQFQYPNSCHSNIKIYFHTTSQSTTGQESVTPQTSPKREQPQKITKKGDLWATSRNRRNKITQVSDHFSHLRRFVE